MSAYQDRPLDNPINWSFYIGRVWGIEIRVHVAFLLCAAVLLWMELPPPDAVLRPTFWRILVDAFGTYAILFAIVLLHEFGHCYGCRKVGGEADSILLWPLGGLAYVHPPHKPVAHLITTLAGPMVNVIICAVCSSVLVAWCGTLAVVPWNPLHPGTPIDPTIPLLESQRWLLRVYGTSYFILLFNLLPIFPFDGGRVAQAWLWPRRGYRTSMELACGTGMVGAIVLGLFGLFTSQDQIIMLMAIFGYLTCWQTRRVMREQGDFAYGDPAQGLFAQGHTYFDREATEARRPGFFERRRLRRAALRLERDRRRQEEHERSVEEVLRKVAQSGLGSLTSRERRILEAETERQRSMGS
ncbi:MAG: hypothetical protein HY763_15475 [Planctomycetes bacterium]|nr:hypothetical protein [Planctomycetota bacterium]